MLSQLCLNATLETWAYFLSKMSVSEECTSRIQFLQRYLIILITSQLPNICTIFWEYLCFSVSLEHFSSLEPTSENSANVAEFCFCCFTAFSYFRQYSIVTNFEENRNIVRICDVSSRSILRPLHLILSMSTFRYCILRGAWLNSQWSLTLLLRYQFTWQYSFRATFI